MKSLMKEGRLTGRERVRRTFCHEKTDRVPIDYAGNGVINQKMMDYFGARNLMELFLALGVDQFGLSAPYRGERLHKELPGRQVDAKWGVVTKWMEHESGGYWDFCEFPLAEADEEAVAAYPMPNPDDFDYATVKAKRRKYPDLAAYVGNPGLVDIINANGRLRGMEQVLIDLITGDPAGKLLTDRRLEIELEITYRTLESCKGEVDFLWIGEDLGMQNAPMISLEVYREQLRPWHQKFIDLAKAYDLPVMIHSCGSSSWAFEDFIEMGVDGVDTLQPEAQNMAPRYLAEQFGTRLAFHGCISTAGPLAYGTPDEVEQNVKDTLETMMPYQGYFLSPSHSIQDNSPLENVLRMYESAQKYGWYE